MAQRVDIRTFLAGIDTTPRKKYSDQDRIALLNITANDQAEIESLEFSRIFCNPVAGQPPVFKIIDLEKLVGVNGGGRATNWMEQLFSLHKQYIFDLYKPESFKTYLASCDSTNEDLPHVIEHNGKYYIDTNGKHRLSIAKCIKIQSAPALVSQASDCAD